MAASIISRGLVSIEHGAIANDGGMGTTLVQVSDTVPGTAKLSTAAPTVNNIEIEESDDPIDVVYKAGARTINFSTRDLSAATLAAFMGGTVVAAAGGAGEIWQAPATVPVIELSFRITDKKGNKFRAPRVSVVATLNGQFENNGTNTSEMVVVGTILIPTKANTSPLEKEASV